jgi:hypothetical protein
MLPFARAESGRPEGAMVTESVSTMSTYSSLEVWRTFARRQGTGELVWLRVGDVWPEMEEPREEREKGVAEGVREEGVVLVTR